MCKLQINRDSKLMRAAAFKNASQKIEHQGDGQQKVG